MNVRNRVDVVMAAFGTATHPKQLGGESPLIAKRAEVIEGRVVGRVPYLCRTDWLPLGVLTLDDRYLRQIPRAYPFAGALVTEAKGVELNRWHGQKLR